MTAALFVAVALPALVGLVLLVARPALERVAAAIGITTAAAVLVAAVVASTTSAELALPFLRADGAGEVLLRVDALAAPVLPTVAAVALGALVFATGDRTRPAARFHGLMLLFLAAVVVTVTATDLAVLLFAWEIMGLTSYALIGFQWRQAHRVEGGLVAFVVTRTGDLGLYLAAGVAVVAGVGWSFDALPAAAEPWLGVLAAGILAAGLGKAAQLPFSFWISRAMAGPSAVSALLHSAAMVAMGGYLLLRLEPVLSATVWAGPVAAWVGAITAIVLGVVALAQTDLKQVLAASTAAQLGFVVLAAGIGATTGGTLQLLAHAAAKALLFLVAGAWLTALGTKKLAGLGGAARRWPLVGIVATAGMLSLAGIPPLSLWAAKDTVLAVAIEHDPLLYAAGLLGAVLSAAYSGRMLAMIWRRPASDAPPLEQEPTGRIGPLSLVPMLVLAVAAVSLGLLALPAPRAALGLPGDVTPTWTELAASGALAVVVLLLAWWRPPRPWAPARDWFGMERLAQRAIVTPTLWLARGLATADDRFARGIDGSFAALRRAADIAARADGAGIDGAVRGVGRGTGRLGALARRSQTGSLHHYYIVAVVVLVIAAGLILIPR
ncbi:proton-conducting transporter membrane subunit [Microbacterium sp. SCN 69-37]|uniref:NADH-quinone oxidoreductase subunit 5 family protein n=1 Tax=Microbacterium sp. SCN 69-37 TaxID=1660115 RepID=UPI00086D71C4|nr:proton-conducting transporter membrane subunit [Microbacterium sp. SCN 69-37]ODT25885.1 MAG: NADH dehydrogenase [Microbacterium sp. SCN 69-37]